MAVEMAKLSLWLLTFAKERPFGFLDHAIREGDSLLGITSLDQLRYLHLDAERGKALHEGTLFDATKTLGAFVDEATRLRRELESLPLVTVRDAEEKARLNALALSKTAAARTIADALVGIELALAGRPGRERENALLQLADDVRHALAESATESARAAAMEAIERTAEARLNAGRPQQAPLRRPLHWPLEFPEVLAKSESGFDLIAGNPPFLGSQLMTARFGTDYRELLVRHVAFGRKGQSDLVAYFFLCASQIGRRVAMLATNTIAQGDTREIGLDGLVARGWTIVRAERSRQWPGSASLQIAEVWLSAKGEQEPRVLDGLRVAGISPFLYPVSRISGNPHVLAANRDIAFQGSTVLGMGFTMPPVEAQSLIAADPRNAEVLFPYINAEDACSRPDLSASRWIINFQDWGEGVAASYQMPFEKLLRDVRPQRLASKGEYRAYWWRFGRRRPGLYEAIRTLRSVIAMPLVSKYVMPVRLPATLVYAHLLGIFASDSGTLFGILSSNVHRSWAKRYGSTLETRFRYTPTNCFETFPLPAAGDDTTGRIMRELDADRRDLMERLNQGLTTTYNRIHDETERDEAIQELRDRHRALDLAVRDAYGWNDLDLAHGFHPTDEGLRFTISDEARIELLDRLLELNHARHTEEVAQDFHVTARRKTGRRRRDSAPSIVTEPIALPLTAASPTAASLPHSAK
ncbi:MAG: type IIL restriction-modification enzyme MmeI [Vulcanimicrobiaceae bacterium]